MNILKTGITIASFLLQYPVEKHLKPDHSKSDALRKSLTGNAASREPEQQAPPVQEKRSLIQTIERERKGDYCVPCVPSKHLQRAMDALGDAMNIAGREGKFTDVAESKIQRAVYELNGAEVDLEQANASPAIKPAVDEMKAQIGKLRNHLRVDQSGLEIATALPAEAFEQAKANLETALNVTGELINLGYDLTKIQIRERANELRASNSGTNSEDTGKPDKPGRD